MRAQSLKSSAIIFACLSQFVTSSNTYQVTSSYCTGPGSFVNALELANANPGPDIIEFVGVSKVYVADCPRAYPPLNIVNTPGAYAYVNDSVEIKGNGVEMIGSQIFVTSGGLLTPLDSICPTGPTSTDIVVQATRGFLAIEGPNVNVTVRNMKIFEHEYILKTVDGCDNCRIVLDGVIAERILPIVTCQQSAIELRSGNNMYLEIVNNQWNIIWNYAEVIPVPPISSSDATIYAYNGAITAKSDATLYIDHSSFEEFGATIGFLNWNGKVDIVSSLLVEAGGGLYIESTRDSNIVNTAWSNSVNGLGKVEPQDRIYNVGSGALNFISSTLFYDALDCFSLCQAEGAPGAIMPFFGAGNITFKWTAIGVNFPDSPPQAPLLDDRYGAFSADPLTWIQPLVNQSTSALKTVTNQPGLLTNPPGLPTLAYGPFYRTLLTPLLGDQATPGVLIDAIPDANSTNKLINPVTGEEIIKDVFGNPRNDGNRRDIGAVQVGDAVTLSVVPNNTCAMLYWNQPSAPAGNSVAGYLVTYMPLPSGPQTAFNLTGATPTSTSICNLTEGVEYEFNVRPFYNTSEVGPPSNDGTMTAYNPFLPPTIFPSGTPTSSEIFTNWTQPVLGGRNLLSFAYIYYPKDLSKPAQVVQTNSTGARITGLLPATVYTICIAAEATNANTVSGTQVAVGNCIEVSTGPVCDDFTATMKAKRRVRAGSKFWAVVLLRSGKGYNRVKGIGIDVTWPNGVAVRNTRFVQRLSKYGTVNVTASGVTITSLVFRKGKTLIKLPLQVDSCHTSTLALGLETFQQLGESYGFRYCDQEMKFVMSCKV